MESEKELVPPKPEVVLLDGLQEDPDTSWLSGLENHPIAKKAIQQCMARIAKEKNKILQIRTYVEEQERGQAKASSPTAVDKSPLMPAENVDPGKVNLPRLG